MKHKIGTVCIGLGVVLLCAALLLFLSNQKEAYEAEISANAVLPLVKQQIPDEPQAINPAELGIPVEFRDPELFVMTEKEIDGQRYIGCLSIPSLELELPIISNWSYSRVKIAPCRYTGSVNGDDLVLMAHNYARHFGRLSQLSVGDSVIFTDMDGITTVYEVVAKDILMPTAVEEMTAGNFDLTLFTCTYGGKSRVTVYCDRATN